MRVKRLREEEAELTGKWSCSFSPLCTY